MNRLGSGGIGAGPCRRHVREEIKHPQREPLAAVLAITHSSQKNDLIPLGCPEAVRAHLGFHLRERHALLHCPASFRDLHNQRLPAQLQPFDLFAQHLDPNAEPHGEEKGEEGQRTHEDERNPQWRAPGPPPPNGKPQVRVGAGIRTKVLRRADRARGFARTSSGDGRSGLA